jgi:hypothetical protein
MDKNSIRAGIDILLPLFINTGYVLSAVAFVVTANYASVAQRASIADGTTRTATLSD